jgi:hypothetical protein
MQGGGRLGWARWAALAAAATLAACAPADDRPPDAVRVSFQEVLEPEAYEVETLARADADAEGAPGYWAAAPGLPRPERALVVNLATGAEVRVALYRGRSGGPVTLSAAAAEAIGLGAEPGRVRVTALRREPTLAAPRRGRTGF